MKTKYIVIAVIAILAAALFAGFAGKNKTNTNTKENGAEKSISKENIIKNFLGKPSFIVLAGTFCPHCKSAMPEYKSEIYDTFAGKINVLINVIDGKGGKRFKEKIPQDYKPEITFKSLTGAECNYVPSWVVLDKDGKVADKSCGGEKNKDVAVEKITELLK